MNYENLKDAIVAVIKQNGNEEITGNILQQVLVAMVNSLGNGYQFKGIATPATDPGTPDQKVFYLASATGTYPNFGFIVSDEICALVYDNAWHKQTIIALDQEPTEDSGNLISSGAIYTALQNLADAYMQLVESAEENHLAVFDGDGQVKDAGIGLDDLALPAGHYPDLFAGFAGNLVDTRSAGTRQSFAFRQSGGDGVNYMRKILGRTEAFNQKIKISDLRSTLVDSSGVTLTNNGDGSFTITGTASANTSIALVESTVEPSVVGHSVLLSLGGGLKFLYYGDGTIYTNRAVVTAGSTSAYRIVLRIEAGVTYNATVWPQAYDLTLEGLGLTTADQFRALHPLGYYNYNAGVLKNNAATGLETTGFNQWDEEWENGAIRGSNGINDDSISNTIRSKNYIPVFPNTVYYARSATGLSCRRRFYDANKNYLGENTSIETNTNQTFTTPVGAYYMRFYMVNTYGTVYNHDICINLSDASRNGEYEPYWKRDIVLGLDNLACHDEDNNAVVVNGLDGVGTSQDELIVENGWGTKINKRRKRVNLGDLTWTKSTSGGYDFFFSGVVSEMKQTYSGVARLICQKYTTSNAEAAALFSKDKQIGENGGRLYVYDSALSGGDAAAFKAAMSGVYADVELATPKVLTLDNPIPALIEVDNLGTEKRLPEDTADNPQAPFECDSNYSISTANLVRKLSQ